MKISQHFTFEEMTYSKVAHANGISNIPRGGQYDNLFEFVRQYLEPLRLVFGRPIYVNSGFRTKRVNELVGGAPLSAHKLGLAADITSRDNISLLKCILLLNNYDQVIVYPRFSFIHYSVRFIGSNIENNRHQLIFKDVADRKTYIDSNKPKES